MDGRASRRTRKRTLSPADFDAIARQRLAGSPDANLRARIERLFASAGDAGRKQVLADHQGCSI